MTALDAITSTLIEAEHAHAAAFASANGVDPEWAVFYADWLVDSSSLPTLVEQPLGRGALKDALVEIDRRHTAEGPDEDWARYYARGLIERFGAAETTTP